MARIVSISNQKGGVGKTTTAINLAAALARSGHPTLLIDLDPQGNASSCLGTPKDKAGNGTAEALLGLEPISNCIVPSQDGLDLCPANRALVGAEVELVNLPNRERRLQAALDSLPAKYTYVIIDLPPSLGLLTLNAFVASDGVVVPLQSEYYAMEGISELVRTINAVRRGPNPRLVRDGIVMTLHDSRVRLCREVEAQAREVFGSEVFHTVIPRAVRLAEAPSFQKTIFGFDPGCRAAAAYQALAGELVTRVAHQSTRATG
jgi:chromosome partitioning protein